MTVIFDFINRKDEIDLFQKMLTGGILERILALVVKPEHGKSSLLNYFQMLCQQQNIPVALIDFDERQGDIVHYWKFVRTVCDDLGPNNFSEVDTAERRSQAGFTPIFETKSGHGGIDFGTKGKFTEADIENVIGRDFIQTGDITTFYGSENQTKAHKEKTMYEIGRAFKLGISRLCQTRQVVLILDTYEQSAEETRKWITEWIFTPFLNFHSNLIIVIAGRPGPVLYDFISRPTPIKNLIFCCESLSSPKVEDVCDYINFHKLTVSIEEMKSFIKVATNKISDLGKLRDAYKKWPYE